ncbi:MerR family DNA-binding transcriptional regulator [Rhodobacter sp. KR11]|uniref:MerR family transcriptional regulator n=1 Tax=Rhodobacter sp. KR11 TaxID=2974588 RepID=UPI002222B82A|nr:MerR family DNA-binding transcriptional regulator [Rhodobacter sp. KR11]MCW1918482.1 MerR family DNA-binding transcriptional regulator [Rhodobacter sp. KR11]
MMDDVLTIGEMCAAYQVTARTLRFYEQKELIWPIRQGSHRLYDRKARARLQLILRGKRFGFSLEDIRQLLDMYEREGSNQAQLERTYAVAVDRLGQMVAQRDELDLAIAELKQELAEGAAMIAAFKAAAE